MRYITYYFDNLVARITYLNVAAKKDVCVAYRDATWVLR